MITWPTCDCATAVFGSRRPGEGHLALHQLARRLDHGWHGHLRHDAVRPSRRGHYLRGPGRVNRRAAAGGRGAEEAVRPAQFAHPDPPAVDVRTFRAGY